MGKYQKESQIKYIAVSTKALEKWLDADDETKLAVLNLFGKYALQIADRQNRVDPSQIEIDDAGLNWGQKNLLYDLLETLVERAEKAHKRYDGQADRRNKENEQQKEPDHQQQPEKQPAKQQISEKPIEPANGEVVNNPLITEIAIRYNKELSQGEKSFIIKTINEHGEQFIWDALKYTSTISNPKRWLETCIANKGSYRPVNNKTHVNPFALAAMQDCDSPIDELPY